MASLIDPDKLDEDQIEMIEKASMRLVFQAIRDFAAEADYIFKNSPDDQTEVAEDITREAMSRLPGFPLPERIFGVMDYKRAGYFIGSELATRQVLLVDSKAEKSRAVARLQTSQTSLPIRQHRAGTLIDVPGQLGWEMHLHGLPFLVTTIFVHYHYADAPLPKMPFRRELLHITIAALPNKMLADTYVPSADDTIFVAGPDAPTRGEAFRTRLSFSRLQAKCRWRVQHLPNPATGKKMPDVWVE